MVVKTLHILGGTFVIDADGNSATDEDARYSISLDNDIALVITADHGNSDRMVYENGEPHTSHTNAPVPFSIIHPHTKPSPLPPPTFELLFHKMNCDNKS